MRPMTWMKPLFARLAPCALLSFALPVQLTAQEADDIMPQTLLVELNESDSEQVEIGELIYRGGLKIEPGEEKIGGISGLEWVDDDADYGGGALWAVSDDGRWLKIQTDESNARLQDLYSIAMGPLRDLAGKRLKKKGLADAEAIARGPDGWIIAFEQQHRAWLYRDLSGPADAGKAPLFDANNMASNKGIETLATMPGGLLFCKEAYHAGENNCTLIATDPPVAHGVEEFELIPPPALIEHGAAPTDATCASDGTCYILLRSYKRGYGNRAAIIARMADGTQDILAIFDAPLTLDNFEGLALREQFGKRYLYIASDDNFNNCFETNGASCQDTLILKFEIKSQEPPAPQISDAPEPDPHYETLDVVLETVMGDITIALEVERAPITTANFLRYIDEGRFDGTVFYRAMSLDREPKPNGLLQGGTQFDPKRILPGIAHEPTTQTGLTHTNGALSMAMGEPGSANGDFSIMLQDQIGLDARPDAQEAVWRNGYAVFGYVIKGMDVVAAIHQSGIAPDKGEGMMRGQMLAKPVTITKARRAIPLPE